MSRTASRDAASAAPSSLPALDMVINNLESDGGSSSGILVDLSRTSTPYSPEQMMAAIRELKNDVNLLCGDQSQAGGQDASGQQWKRQ